MSKIYLAKVIEECANGDAIIELPSDLMTDCDWREEDVIDLDVDTERNCLIMRNLSKEQRDKHE